MAWPADDTRHVWPPDARYKPEEDTRYKPEEDTRYEAEEDTRYEAEGEEDYFPLMAGMPARQTDRRVSASSCVKRD